MNHDPVSGYEPPRKNKPPIGPGVVILSCIAVAVFVYSWQTGRLGQFEVSLFKVFLFVSLVPSVILHEVSHGALAHLYGDDTAKRAGRLSLNPLRHVDPWLTFIIPAMLVLTVGFAIGGAKPVPVDTARMSRNQSMFTGLVGPAVNLVLVVIATVALGLPGIEFASTPWLFLYAFGTINVLLAVFNLLPIPPLDGSSVVERFLPQKYWPGYLRFRRYSFFVLLAVMLFGLQAVSKYVFGPALDLWQLFIQIPTVGFV